MENAFFWAQIIGFIAMVLSVSVWQISNSRLILKLSFPTGLLWGMQYLLLGAPVGALMNIANGTKDGILSFIDKRYARYIIFAFLAFVFSFGLYNYTSWYDLLPLLGTATINFALFYDRDNKGLFARAMLINQVMWFTYNFIVGAYMGSLCATLVFTSSIIGMARHEAWDVGRCYRSFAPSLIRAILVVPILRTDP